MNEVIYENPDDFELKPNNHDKHMYYSNPEDVARMVGLFISLHEDTKGGSVRLEQTWDELGLDDFGKMDVIFSLEKEFGIEVHVADIERFRTVGDFVEYLSKSFFVH